MKNLSSSIINLWTDTIRTTVYDRVGFNPDKYTTLNGLDNGIGTLYDRITRYLIDRING